MIRIFFATILLFTVGVFSNVHASSNSNGVIVQPELVIPYAKRVEHELAKRGAHVAIVARVGQDPKDLPSGIEYTHVAFWVYSEMALPSGETVNGYVVHNLYQLVGDSSQSELITDFPVEFFGDVYELRSGIIIPEPAVQQRLIEFIGSKDYKGLHVPNYSLIANPHKRSFQNCTNFILNALVGAVYQTGNVQEIQSHIDTYYEPQKVGVNGFERLFGSIFINAVATSDHDGDIKTSTYGSLLKFMNKYDLVQSSFEITE